MQIKDGRISATHRTYRSGGMAAISVRTTFLALAQAPKTSLSYRCVRSTYDILKILSVKNTYSIVTASLMMIRTVSDEDGVENGWRVSTKKYVCMLSSWQLISLLGKVETRHKFTSRKWSLKKILSPQPRMPQSGTYERGSFVGDSFECPSCPGLMQGMISRASNR